MKACISSRMETYTKESSRMEIGKERVLTHGLTKATTEASGLLIR